MTVFDMLVRPSSGTATSGVMAKRFLDMGYVQEELAEDGQSVVGAIIALEDDQRICRALTMAPNISFYRYLISFKLVKG